jgi:hypothetical protein
MLYLASVTVRGLAGGVLGGDIARPTVIVTVIGLVGGIDLLNYGFCTRFLPLVSA